MLQCIRIVDVKFEKVIRVGFISLYVCEPMSERMLESKVRRLEREGRYDEAGQLELRYDPDLRCVWKEVSSVYVDDSEIEELSNKLEELVDEGRLSETKVRDTTLIHGRTYLVKVPAFEIGEGVALSALTDNGIEDVFA